MFATLLITESVMTRQLKNAEKSRRKANRKTMLPHSYSRNLQKVYHCKEA